nr:retrovirus-related Pol polyprotein from transposon TNT 1-94 [Tanacetum cinerariifolium]
MAKATSSQAWLWHHRLSHLNFDTINLLSKNDIIVGLPKLKFIKDHLCYHNHLKIFLQHLRYNTFHHNYLRRVEHLEYDNVAQALEITKLKRRVKKLEKRNKEEDMKVEVAKVVESTQVQGREAESQAEIYKIDMDHANKVLSMQEDETEPAKVQEVIDVVTTTKLITEVVTAVSETVTTASAIIPTAESQVPTATLTAALARVAAAPSRRRKGVQQIEMKEKYARKLHAELNKDIDWDVAIDHVELKAKEDPSVKRYQAMKRKPQTKAQARKNIMMYLKNVAGFKLDYFKGMSYDDIRLIFEAKFNSNVDFLLKTKEHMEEKESRALQTINETLAEKAAKRRKLNKEVEDLKRHLDTLKPLHLQEREDLEALWNLVKERFSTSKPKNFSANFLLTTLGAMFEKLDALAQV